MAKSGHPKTFKNGDELIALWDRFCTEIVEGGFLTIPSQTAFCRWLAKNYQDTDRKTIYNSLNKYFPDIKKRFEQVQSDTIMQGGMLGHYQPTMSIFGLKNWCGWGDAGRVSGPVEETEDDPLTKSLREEAGRMDGDGDCENG